MADTKDLKKFRGGIRLDASTDTAPTNPEVGAMYVDTNGTLKIYNGSAWDSVGSGAGTTNYINTAESKGDSIAGFNTYADAAAVTPVDGTAGTATTGMLSQDTSTKLRGVNSVKLLKKASTAEQGMGISYDFTIDKADKAKKMLISFDYMEGTSGDYTDGDARVFIYDKDNSKLIRVNGENIKANTGMATHYAQFQTAADSDDYRLIIHIADAGNGATHDWELFLDNISVAPIVANTNSALSGQDVVCTGAGVTGLSLAHNTSTMITTHWDNITADTTNSFSAGYYTIPETGYYDVTFSFAHGWDADTDVGQTQGNIKVDTGSGDTTIRKAYNYSSDMSGTDGVGGQQVTTTLTAQSFNKGDKVSFWAYQWNTDGDTIGVSTDDAHCMFAIAKRQSAVSATPGASGRDIVCTARGLSGTTTHNSGDWYQVTNYNTPIVDTTNSWDSANDKYVIPETGYYDLSISVKIDEESSPYSMGACLVTYYLNGVQGDFFGQNYDNENTTVTSGAGRELSGMLSIPAIHFQKGDELKIYAYYQGGDAQNEIVTAAQYTWFSIAKRQSAQIMLDNETVACRVTKDDVQSVAHATTVPIRYDDIDYDTHGAYHLTDDKYIVPVTGYYDIYAKMRWEDIEETPGMNFQIYILVGGVNKSQISDEASATNTTSRSLQIQDTLLLNKGDEVTIAVYHTDGSAEGTMGQATDMVFTIKKIK